MKKKEIDDFIKSTNITQDQYVAPTVKHTTVSRNQVQNNLSKMYPQKESYSPLVTVGKTIGNVFTNMGEGAIRDRIAPIVQTANQISDDINNFLQYGANKVIYGKKKADEQLKKDQKVQREFYKRDLLKDFENATGYSDVKKDWEKGSLVTSKNIGGQLSQMAGGLAFDAGAVKLLGGGGAIPKTPLKGLKGAELAKALGGNFAKGTLESLPGYASLGASSFGSGVSEGLNRGESLGKSRQFGISRIKNEVIPEMAFAGLPGTNGVGSLDEIGEAILKKTGAKGITKAVGKSVLRNVGEGLEESATDVLDAYSKKNIFGDKINKEELKKEALRDFGFGFAGGALLNAGQTANDIRIARNENLANKLQTVQGLNEVEREALTGITQKIKAGEEIDANDIATIQYLNSKSKQPTQTQMQTQPVQTTQNTPLLSETSQPSINTQEVSNVSQMAQNEPLQQTQFKPVDTGDKLQNFRNSIENERMADTEGFYKSIEKVIQDKDYNVLFDSSITNDKGQPVNAMISNENGITIKINPNSKRAGEILLTHEITHGIETKEMSNLIMDYASKNSEFNDALQNLKQSYGTEEITPEVVADISGQLLGNQEFIMNLRTEKPNIFQRIYERIIELKNKITGNSNEARFIRDLEVKWRRAYRESNIKSAQQNLREGAKYSQNSNIGADKVVDNKFKNANDLTKVKTGYENVPDNLLGFTKNSSNNKGYNESKYKYNLDLMISVDGGKTYFEDSIKGMNKKQAIERAKRNWGVDAIIKENNNGSQNSEMSNQVDNDGNQLSNDQVEYFDESKARDENGNLVKVYHTTTGPVIQFNEFNPVGTPRYKFGNQVVNYYTSSKEMSGSYDESNSYEMAETKRLNNSEEAQQWLDEIGIADLTIEGNEVYEDGIDPVLKYNSTDELLRNLKSDIQREYGNELPIQFEGYLNIKKPFVVDAGGKRWSKVVVELDQEVEEVSKQMEKYKKELHDLAEESEKKYNDYLGNTSSNRDIARKIITYSNSDLLSIDHEGILGFVDNYKEFYDKAKEFDMGYDIPEPGTPMSDIVDYWDLDELKETYDEYYVDNFINMTIDEFIKEYHKLYEQYVEAGAPQAWFENNYKKIIDDQINTNVISDNSWFYISKDNFNRSTIEEHSNGKSYETNDIVKRIIEINKDKIEKEKYDGVIFKNVVDYGWGRVENHDPHDVYVTFASNQFKASDNLNPTSDPDIRYSKEAKKWQDFLDKYFQSRGTTTTMKKRPGPKPKNTKDTNINERKSEEVISAKTPKDVVSSFDKAKKGQLDGKQLRSWVETSNVATGNEKLISKADKDKITYEVKSNKKTFEEAQNNLKNLSYEQKLFRASDKLNTNKKITPTDLAEAQIALLEASERGDIKAYLNLQQDIAIMGTELGQAVQSLSMIQKMSPDGQIAMLNKIVNRQQKLGNKNFEGVKIKEELVKKVLDSYNDASHTTFNKEKMDEAVDDLKQDIADQMKTSAGEKINNWRYLSMLGNPKTHIRNVVANVAMSIVKGTKDTVSAVGESAAQKVGLIDQTQRTKTIKKASEDVKALADVAYNETFEASKGNKYNERNELENRKQIFNNKVLEGARKINEKALDVEDQAFKKINFKKSFSSYLTAQRINTTKEINEHPEIVAAAKAFALQEAKVATFQQDNSLAKWINKADNLGTAGKVIRGAIIPFTRTPLNIAKTGIEYAPGLGFATAISDFKKAPDNMKGSVLIDGISKQVTGGALALLGYALAKSGWVTGDEGDDKEAQFEKDQGAKMGYSIKIGDKSYDLSWLSPSSMPFFVGARMFEVLDKQEKINPDIIIESIASTLDPLSEMSCISSFTKVLKSFNSGSMGMIKDMGETTIQNYISQFVPTVSSQFARLFDTKKRTTAADNTSGNKFFQETGRQLSYKIPGLRNKLPESTDYYGDAKKESDNALMRAFESFISPANTRKDTMSKQSKELVRLYRKTGNDEILPSALQKYINFNDKKFDMSEKEYNKYKKEFGKAFKENLSELMDSYDYKSASDDEKAEMVKGIMEYSKDKTKNIFLTNKGEDYTKTNKDGTTSYYESDKVDDIVGNNYSIADYYMYKVNAPEVVSGKADTQKKKLAFTNVFDVDPETYSDYLEGIGDIKADYNSRGKAIRNSRKRKIVNYLNSFDLTPNQKAALLKQNYSSYRDYDNAIYNSINNSDLSIEEKESLASFLKIK